MGVLAYRYYFTPGNTANILKYICPIIGVTIKLQQGNRLDTLVPPSINFKTTTARSNANIPPLNSDDSQIWLSCPLSTQRNGIKCLRIRGSTAKSVLQHAIASRNRMKLKYTHLHRQIRPAVHYLLKTMPHMYVYLSINSIVWIDHFSFLCNITLVL